MFSAKLKSLEIRQKRFIFDPLIMYGFGSALLINIIHWALVYFKLGRTQGTILLHYNIIYGTDFVDHAAFAYLIPLTASVLLIINIILASYFYRKEKLAAYFLNFGNLPIQLIFLAASITLVLINE
jgi:hypothetical protein